MLKTIVNRLFRKKVVYGSDFFADAWFREWLQLRLVLAAMLSSEPEWKSILDFGCGPGVMIDLMRDKGVDYMGCDYSVEARQLYLKHFGKFPDYYVTNLEESAISSKDVMLAFDVLEHMLDDEIEGLLKKVSSISELLFNISRARGIAGHINLKSDLEWITFMRKQGYEFQDDRTRKLRIIYTQMRPGSPDAWDKNLFLFQRIGDR
ncbi:MAG: methyltransferase domain-containing protein [Betaproteobacteria bacterium]|nr:methyltransferase domain-containing protein [Betaproteobacteria bacterium]NBY03949.1 methyltransferase domain-containing protein [Betaproteobacteria bacterium]